MIPGFPRVPGSRLLLLGVVVAASCLLAPRGVSAQDLEAELEGAPPDSLEGELEPGAPGAPAGPGAAAGATPTQTQNVPPMYSTSYNTDRTTAGWLQNFKFNSRVGFLGITNTTNFNVYTDSSQDQTRRVGDNRASLQWLFVRQLPINTDIFIGRETLARPDQDRERNDLNLNASAVFSPSLAGVRNTLTVGGGYNRQSDTSIKADKGSKTIDSGLQGNMSWRGIWRASRALNMNANLRAQLSNRTSTLESVDALATSSPTKNRQRAFNLTANYNPLSWASSSLTLTDNRGEDQSFFVQAGEGFFEVKSTKQSSLNGQFTLTPRKGSTVTMNFNVYDNSLKLSQRRDNASDSDGYRWDVGVNTEILRTEIQSNLSGSTDNSRPATSAGQRNVTNNFEGKAVRPMNPKVTLQFDWLVRANQLFYSDQFLDRDEFRTKLQPTLIYTPGRKWQVNATVIRSTIEQVQLNPDRASGTRSDESYTADISLTFHVSDRTTLSQIYSIKALYTTYRYNPSSDYLLRTQLVYTTLESNVTDKVFLGVEHRFTRQDSGPFRFESGGRIFARDQRGYTQELTATVDYTIAPWIIVNLSSRLTRNDDITEATQEQFTYRNLEAIQGVTINRNMGLGMNLQAKAFHTRSNVRPSYWTVASSLNKEF